MRTSDLFPGRWDSTLQNFICSARFWRNPINGFLQCFQKETLQSKSVDINIIMPEHKTRECKKTSPTQPVHQFNLFFLFYILAKTLSSIEFLTIALFSFSCFVFINMLSFFAKKRESLLKKCILLQQIINKQQSEAYLERNQTSAKEFFCENS